MPFDEEKCECGKSHKPKTTSQKFMSAKDLENLRKRNYEKVGRGINLKPIYPPKGG